LSQKFSRYLYVVYFDLIFGPIPWKCSKNTFKLTKITRIAISVAWSTRIRCSRRAGETDFKLFKPIVFFLLSCFVLNCFCLNVLFCFVLSVSFLIQHSWGQIIIVVFFLFFFCTTKMTANFNALSYRRQSYKTNLVSKRLD